MFAKKSVTINEICADDLLCLDFFNTTSSVSKFTSAENGFITKKTFPNTMLKSMA